jgi:hypothetical protein
MNHGNRFVEAPPLAAILLAALLFPCSASPVKAESTEGPNQDAASESSERTSLESSGLNLRADPLRHLETRATIQASDFGIRPGAGEDIAPALARLTAHLATLSEPTLVTFEKGTYRVAVPEGQRRAVFALADSANLIIDGNGAEFVVQTPQTDFTNLARCRNIIVRNFVVDGDPLPFTQGTVVGVDRGRASFDFQIDPGHRELSEENLAHTYRLSRRWGMLKDKDVPGRLKSGAPNHLLVELTTEEVGQRTFRLHLTKKDDIRAFEIGDRYVQFIEGVATSNSLQDTSDITFQNITMHCAGASYVGVRNKNINILACLTVLKDDRLVSSTADGILLQTGETGPWVEDVVFEGISDDAINIYQKPVFVREVLGEDRLLLVREHTPVNPGDMLTFFDPAQGRVMTRLRVVSAQEGPKGIEAVFEGTVPPVRTGGVRVLGGGARGADLEGAGKEATHLYNESYLSGPAVIRNSVFKNSRNMAIKIQSHNVLVENMHIEGWDRYGIFVSNLVGYPEGFLGDNFIIRNNLIKDCGFNQGRVDGVYARFQALGQVPSASAEVGNLRVTGNLIVNPGARGIDIASFSGVEVRDNTIVFSDDIKRPAAISMANTPDSSVAGNTILTAADQSSDSLVSLEPGIETSNNAILTGQDPAALAEKEKQWRTGHRIGAQPHGH